VRNRNTLTGQLGVGEPVDEREQPRGRRRCSRQVDRRPPLRPLIGDQPQRPARCGQREREVDEHAQPPGNGLGEDAAEQQPEYAAAADDRAEDPERLAALGRLGERGRQQSQRRRSEDRREDALDRARGDKHPERACGAADRRCDRESQQSAREGPLASPQVAEPSAEQQQRPERERVCGHDPLPGVGGEAERQLSRRQRHVHDRQVEHDHQLRQPDHGQDQPAPLVPQFRSSKRRCHEEIVSIRNDYLKQLIQLVIIIG
jgi:hypothetical protein